MENLKIAVVSQDEAYNRIFCMSLLHTCRQIETKAFTSWQFVDDWSDYAGPGAFYDCFDLILWAGDEISEFYGDNIVYLTDRMSDIKMDYAAGKFAIYRYSPAPTIVAEIFDIYSHLTGRGFPIIKRDDVKLIVFASYCGGSGCTTAARSAAQELVRFHGKRVLCISLEDVDSSGDYLKVPEGKKTEGEFLYRLLSKGSRPFLESYLITDDFGVRSFAPPGGRNPLGDLSAEDMKIMLAALMDSGSFDYVIADLSTCLTEAAAVLMDASERICVTAKSAEPGMREISYMNQLAGYCGEEITDRIMRTEIIHVESGTMNIPAHLEGDFGKEISKLTDKLINVVK
ncbi:MAG: hypothetical protein ACSW8G_01480 [Bacillota bacterium]